MNQESAAPGNESDATTEQIAQCAYYIWEREGYPDGRALEHWGQAEGQIRERISPPPQTEGIAPEASN